MKRVFLLRRPLILLVFASSFLQSQQLTVQTDAGKQTLSRSDLEALPHEKVTTSEHGSSPVSFEGVTVKSVLEKAASPSENR
jgi:hypothetical protein